jgi:hypothetical protein
VFPKLCVLIISMGAVACTLLALRQQRIEAVHQMAMVNLRIMEADRGVAKLRTEIAANLEPKKIEEIASKIGALRPIETLPTRPGALPNDGRPVYARGNVRGTTVVSVDDGAYGGGVSRP